MNEKWNDLDLKDHTGVAAIIKDKEGRILVLDSSKHGKVGLPGGKMEDDEQGFYFYSLVREVYEEVGLDIKTADMYKEFTNTYQRDGKDIDINIKLFDNVVTLGNVENKEPHNHKWVKFLYPETILAVYGDRLMDNLKVALGVSI